MSSRSQALLSCGALCAMFVLVSACTDDGRPVPLSGLDFVPPGDAETNTNVNIDNPTLNVPATFEVSPGDVLTLVWSDEFDGAKLDPEVWFFATGDGSEEGLPGGWGNNELQYYLPDNAQLANGVLSITARRESVDGLNYTSARINTEDRFAFKYGRIEASIKLPAGQGLWPAFWMLSQDSPYGGWAATGEIDIVEAINLDGSGGNEIFGTIHFGGEFPANASASARYTPSADITEDFHTYALEWDEFEMRWYFDDTLYAVQNSWFSTAAAYPAPFDQPFHILLNLAVGGNFPGSPSGATVFPVTMEVDWVRVYSGEDGNGGGVGIIPEAVVYATDPGVTEDLLPPAIDNFGSGAVFNGAFAGDVDYNPAFQVASGEGYGAGVHVGFVAFNGYAAGFAAGYGTFEFKAKVNAPGSASAFEVKFINGGDTSRTYDLTTYSGSTALGNGWYQVQIPMSDFAATIAANSGFLLGPVGAQSGPFTMLLTDIGFSGTAGGGTCDVVGGEYAVNGDFEAGDLSCFEVFQNGGSLMADNTENNGGSWSAHAVAGTGDNPVLKLERRAVGVVMGNDIIDISFDMKGVAADGGVIFPEFISEGAGGATNSQLLATIAAPTAGWTRYSYSPTAAADVSGGITFQIAVVCGGVPTCTANVFIDNVSMTIR